MEHFNDTHRQYPRTLEQAFGPHCRRVIEESDPPPFPGTAIFGGLLAVVIFLILFGLLLTVGGK